MMRTKLTNLLLVIAIFLNVTTIVVSGNNLNEGETQLTIYESEAINDHIIVSSPANAPIVKENELENITSKNLSSNSKYMLAKIAMAEAEGESLKTKIFVILTILNRVNSNRFPNTIEEVIFQSSNGTYQFTPVENGRYFSVEPNEDCWTAVEMVDKMKDDISNGALYFEACSGESWHSVNLELICQLDNTRFYK